MILEYNQIEFAIGDFKAIDRTPIYSDEGEYLYELVTVIFRGVGN